MMVQDDVVKIIYAAIDEVNVLVAEDEQIPKTKTTPLIGDGATVNSLGLINLLVALEQQVETVLGNVVILTQDDVLLQPDGPLKTVGSLADYMLTLLDG